MASVAVTALEAELKKACKELESIQTRQRQAQETVAELLMALRCAAVEA